MILSASAVLALSLQCAPVANPQTMLALSRVESGLAPLAIGRLHGAALAQPKTRQAAIAAARALIARGETPDIGLAQINSTNLARLGLTLEAAFDPCRNLGAAAHLLHQDFLAARTNSLDDRSALLTALSLYNSGDKDRGFRNGYVARVVAAARPGSPRSNPNNLNARAQPISDLPPGACACDFVITPEPIEGSDH